MIRETQKPDKNIIITIVVRDSWLWKYLLLRSVRCEEGRWRSLPTRTTLDQSAHCVPRRFSMGHYNQPVWDATTTQYGNATTRYGALQAASKVFYYSLWDTATQYGALQPACMGSYYQYHISTSQYACFFCNATSAVSHPFPLAYKKEHNRHCRVILNDQMCWASSFWIMFLFHHFIQSFKAVPMTQQF